MRKLATLGTLEALEPNFEAGCHYVILHLLSELFVSERLVVGALYHTVLLREHKIAQRHPLLPSIYPHSMHHTLVPIIAYCLHNVHTYYIQSNLEHTHIYFLKVPVLHIRCFDVGYLLHQLTGLPASCRRG